MKRNNEVSRRKEMRIINGARITWSITFSVLSIVSIFAGEMLDVTTGLFGEGGNLLVVALVCIILALAPFTGNILRMFRKAF